MAAPKPTILIVPGAWHPSALYKPLEDHLHNSEFPTSIVDLPSVNPKDPSTATCRADTDLVRKHLAALIEKDGKDVILLPHSYGGIPAGAAARGFAKGAEGNARGIVALVYMTGFLVPECQSTLVFLGGKHAPFVMENSPVPNLLTAKDPKSVFYGDLDASVAAELERALLPHASLAFESPVPPPAWTETELQGRLAFLRCTQDQAIPVAMQDTLVERSGVKWIMMDLGASHSPFASQPEVVAGKVSELWDRWA